jgi:hypothetical protein
VVLLLLLLLFNWTANGLLPSGSGTVSPWQHSHGIQFTASLHKKPTDYITIIFPPLSRSSGNAQTK